LLKVAWLVRLSREREREVDRDEHWRRYAEEHAQLLGALPGLERASDNHTLTIAEGPQAGTGEPTVDGLICTWWPERATLDRALATPQWRALADHGNAHSDGGWPYAGAAAAVEERVMRTGAGTPWRGATVPAAMCKHVGVLYFRPGMARAEASEYWTDQHGTIALGVPEILYYVQNHATGPLALDGGDAGGRFPFDGFSEAWFSDRDTFERAHASPAWQRLQADSPNLFDVDAIESGVNCVVAERVVSE
jgi:uncharacterized protein (TIGR02118 family)